MPVLKATAIYADDPVRGQGPVVHPEDFSRAGNVAQLLECMPSMLETLRLSHSTLYTLEQW